MYTYHTLTNGLKAVHCRRPGSAAAYFGLTVRAGSRDEQQGACGLAHFVEHTLFKGTDRRSAWHIINRMESVGGELNAFTTKEETTVYTAFPARHLRRAIELLADLVINSRFPQREIDRERQVVADEIDSYLDQPSEAVFDDFDDLLFANCSLGHNILGTKAELDTFTSEDCRRWLDRWYTADNMVAFYSGPASPERVFAAMEAYLQPIAASGSQHAFSDLSINSTFDLDRPIDSHQTHTVIGSRIDGMYSPERFTYSLLANILGGPGMNSLLNVELRERRGLVYTVEASTAYYTDCGVMSIYYGCDHDDNDRCRKLVAQQIQTIAEGSYSRTRLEMAQRQYLGQLLLAGENQENAILSAARATLFHGRAADRSEINEYIEQITLHRLAMAAGRLLDSSRLSLT